MRAVDDLDVFGCFAGSAFDFLMAVVADQQDVEVILGEADGFAVHLGDQRAGRVDGAQAAVLGGLDDRRRDAVRGKDHQGALGDLVGFVDEDGALLLQGADHVDVVHDLLAHVDGRAVVLQRFFHRDDRAVNAGAVAARGRQQDLLGAGDGGRRQHVFR